MLWGDIYHLLPAARDAQPFNSEYLVIQLCTAINNILFPLLTFSVWFLLMCFKTQNSRNVNTASLPLQQQTLYRVYPEDKEIRCDVDTDSQLSKTPL